jgi:thymidylate kinase
VNALPPGPLRDLFDALGAARIPYVVLRGYLPLAELTDSLDIDVYIPRRALPAAAAVLSSRGWLERRHQTGRYPHRFFDNFAAPGRVCTMLDVVTDLCYGDRLYTLAGAEQVLGTTSMVDDVRVPHPWIAQFLFSLHVLLDKDALSEANARRGRELWALCLANADGALLLERGFGATARALTEAFGAWVAAAGGTEGFALLRRQATALSCLRAQPVRGWLDRWRVRVRNRTRRPFRIAVLGMDGAGKSTMIRHALGLPCPLPIGAGYLGYNEFTTPPFRWMIARLAALAEAGRGDSVQVRVLDKVRALWWPVELYARMRRAERGKAIVLYDRYPFPRYEREEGPTTFPGRVMERFERFWTAVLPQPDALLFCDGEPEVLWRRKQEYPFAVYGRAHARYVRLYQEFRRERHLLRTDQPLPKTLATIPEILRGSLALRRRLYRDGDPAP